MSDILINQINPLQQLEELERKAGKLGEASAGEFQQVFQQALNDVNELQKTSAGEIDKLLKDEVSDVHTAMIALQKADLSFQMMMQVRNKLVEAYQEIMRMQV
ncbi:MAG: flagellar hook-basal body complex protein FliE [Acidobacteriota bacterium]